IARFTSVLLLASFVATFVLSCLDAYGTVHPQVDFGETANMLGAAISLGGIALMIVSQYQMGAAWRFGVDEAERTDLVTGGLYTFVRNPIYSGVFLFLIGLLVLLPHVFMLVFIATAWLSIELQVRFVEEPHLRGLHGADYEKYADQTGRYFPRLRHNSGR
ncbi:MAG: isoprenylcysteine carboxylmethyltransferase family protein, partial [Nitrospinae bacterium]|nr:isoprenylcysteine carboxylmethyltransferase family protein [Nitrospinota bacterium]